MIIEVVNRSGYVVEHSVFDKQVIRIGRAYDNDLILHDIHIDERHLSLTYLPEEDEFLVEDLDTVNGTRVLKQEKRRDLNNHPNSERHYRIRSGETLCLGKTLIRLKSRVHQVPAAVPISLTDQLLNSIGKLWVFIPTSLILFALVIYNNYLNRPQLDLISQHSMKALYNFIFIFAYAGLWSLIAAIAKKDNRFLVHSSVVVFFLIALSLFELAKPALLYNLPLGSFAPYFDDVIVSTAVFIGGIFSLYLSTRLSTYKRMGIAATIPLLILFYNIAALMQKNDFNPFPSYDGPVVAPHVQLIPAITENEFIELSDDLY